MNKEKQLQKDIEALKELGIDAFDEKYAPKTQIEATPYKAKKTNEFVSVSEFHYKGKSLDSVGCGDSFAYFPCDIYGTPKLYYGDSHYSCAGQAFDDILDSFNAGSSYDWFDDNEFDSTIEEIWWNSSEERGRVFFGKYIVVGEDGHIPSREYVLGIIKYMGGSPNDYIILFNLDDEVKELPVSSFLASDMNTNNNPSELYVPDILKRIYNEVTNKRAAVDSKFPSNMTRAEYYWLTRQENRKIDKVVIETINQYLKQNLILN